MHDFKIKEYRFFLITLLIGFFCIYAVSCSPEGTLPQQAAEANLSYVPSVTPGDFAHGELEAHYQKHGYQFGNISKKAYLDGARVLLNAAPSKDVLQKIRTNGDILHYRVSTGEFAVMTAQGRIRTYFKADYRYWVKQ